MRTIGCLKITACFIAGLCFAVSGRAEAAMEADWPMWNHDAARSGVTSMELPDELHLQWVRRLPAPRRAWPKQLDDGDKLEFDLSYSPVVMGDKIFVPSMVRDRLTAYRIEDGTEVWRHYVDGPVRLAPAAWNGRVYFVSDDGHLYCLDAETGKRLWAFNAAPMRRLVLGNNRVVCMWAARGGPVVKDGIVYFAAGVWPMMGTFIYALDAETGEVVWANTGEASNFQIQPHGGAHSFAGIAPQGYLAATEDRLIVSGGRSTPALLDRRTGEILRLHIFFVRIGGYRVAADEEFFYNHGLQYRLEDGAPAGAGEPEGRTVSRRAEELSAELDGPVFEALAARGRLFVTTTEGALYCFGAAASDRPIVHDYEPASATGPNPVDGDRRTASILGRAGELNGGYALVLGAGDGSLIERLALRSGMHVVGIDPDEAKIGALRRRFDDAGLYGTRIALLPGRAADMNYPPYISSLVVVDDPAASGLDDQAVYELLRPYGGTAFVGAGTVLSRDGPLPGAGQWTHEYADAARTTVSHDDGVRLPLGVLWYGSVGNHNVLPRHAMGPRPQVSGGRLAILGVEIINVRCVYTGRELWVREFPGIGRFFTDLEDEERWRELGHGTMARIPGAAYIGSPYVTLPDSIYLRHGGIVFRLNPETGATLSEFPIYPENHELDEYEWGPVSVWENLLITTSDPHRFDDTRPGWGDWGARREDPRGPEDEQRASWNAASSRRLLVMDRFSGETLWTRDAAIGFRHNAIAAAGGRVFVIDGLSEKALSFKARRGLRPEENSRVLALDAFEGNTLWENESGVFGTYLAYSEEHDILLESGSHTRARLFDEPVGRVVARSGSDGEILWTGNGPVFPAALHGGILYPARVGAAVDLLTGEPVISRHPLTGEEIEDSYSKFYGCGTVNASTHFLLFRSGAAGFADLEYGGGTGNFGGFKSGCTPNLIVADGILNAPDYTRTCRCSYQNQTSLGLIHMPGADVWTFTDTGRGEGPVRRLGVNRGAPGNRRSDDGTLWVPMPNNGVPSPGLRALLNTVDFPDAPVRVVAASYWRVRPEFVPGHTLDGNPHTRLEIPSRGIFDRRFRREIRYDLNDHVTLDRIEAMWSGPEETQFRIMTSADGNEWTTVFEEESEGSGAERGVYRFEPVTARHVRLYFGDHGDEVKDNRGRPMWHTVRVSDVRIGDLAYPDAYAHFRFRVNRRHSLEVDGANGLNWVSASGITGLRCFELLDVNGGNKPYIVRLHFAEPDGAMDGERVFDIHIQGEKAASGFDINALAGGPNRAVTRSFDGVKIDQSLRIELKPDPRSKFPPFLCGVEIVLEDFDG